MNPRARDPLPASLLIAVIGSALSAVGLVGIAVAVLATRMAIFSAGIAVVLLVYGALVGLGAWLGWRRQPLARGLIVAPALLHLATAVSLAQGSDPLQRGWAIAAAVAFAGIVVAAVLPATRRALETGPGTA